MGKELFFMGRVRRSVVFFPWLFGALIQPGPPGRSFLPGIRACSFFCGCSVEKFVSFVLLQTKMDFRYSFGCFSLSRGFFREKIVSYPLRQLSKSLNIFKILILNTLQIKLVKTFLLDASLLYKDISVFFSKEMFILE